MPAWPEKRTWIGSRATRVDGPAKVTGAAKYSSDVQPEGWLYGMILRSKWPKAKITAVNPDQLGTSASAIAKIRRVIVGSLSHGRLPVCGREPL